MVRMRKAPPKRSLSVKVSSGGAEIKLPEGGYVRATSALPKSITW